MIRTITLKNFMSHADTVIELADGLTVLTGPNNCGKSALVSALQILAAGGKTKHVTRHGETVCQISVETDEGENENQTILWERKKSTVKYQINGEDIHRTGQGIPDQLHDHLRLDRVTTETGKTKAEYDIHFGEQKSPVFLLGESGSRAAAFFASSSDASRLIEMQNNHRSRQQENRKEKKRLTAEIETNRQRHTQLEPLDAIRGEISAAEKLHARIAASENRQTQLKNSIAGLKALHQNQTRLGLQTQVLQRLDNATITPERLLQNRHTNQRLKSVMTGLRNRDRQQRDAVAIKAKLNDLASPPALEPTDRLRALVRNLKTTGTQKRFAAATAHCCEPLSPPPERHNTQKLAQHLSNLKKLRHEASTARNQLNCLDPLAGAPESESGQPLRQTLSKLSQASANCDSAARVATALAGLTAPEPLAEPASLKTTIQCLKTQTKTTRDAAATFETIDQQFGQHEDDVRQFVSAHPKCETCGSSIDPETLLSAMPLNHTHKGGGEVA